MYGCDSKTMVEIELVNLCEGLINVLDLLIGQVINCSEADLAAECDEKWNPVHKKNVTRQEYLLVEL